MCCYCWWWWEGGGNGDSRCGCGGSGGVGNGGVYGIVDGGGGSGVDGGDAVGIVLGVLVYVFFGGDRVIVAVIRHIFFSQGLSVRPVANLPGRWGAPIRTSPPARLPPPAPRTPSSSPSARTPNGSMSKTSRYAPAAVSQGAARRKFHCLFFPVSSRFELFAFDIFLAFFGFYLHSIFLHHFQVPVAYFIAPPPPQLGCERAFALSIRVCSFTFFAEKRFNHLNAALSGTKASLRYQMTPVL